MGSLFFAFLGIHLSRTCVIPRFPLNYLHSILTHIQDSTEDPKPLSFADSELIDLSATKQGEQLFVDGYKLGYHHGKTGIKALHRKHSSWDDAAESAMAHLKQSFAHDEAEARRALRKAL